MAIDLSYINETPSEAQEQAVAKAVEVECLKAIVLYLDQIADTMEEQKIETLNVPTIRSMSQEMQTRVNNHGNDSPS
jgi:hypothetical protein